MRFTLWLVAGGAIGVHARPSLEKWEDGSDLETFVSRPDIRAPRMLVWKHQPERIADGYWFMNPYSHYQDQQHTDRREFYPGQTGAHIYDRDGDLVWSGARWGGNRNIFGGFQPFTVDGKQYLSMIVPPKVVGEHISTNEKIKSCVILDNQYQEVSRTVLPKGPMLDSHEFNVLPGGKTAVVITDQILEKDAAELNQTKRVILENGFEEIEISTGAPVFSWVATEHGVLLNESFDVIGMKMQDPNFQWDYMHLNAADKSPDGDYYVSGRHAHTIYKVSGKDGHIIWRLGGHASDFEMEEGVNFHWQHHVRFHSQNETTTVISLFDNSDEEGNRNPGFKPKPTSAKILALDTASSPMRARLIRRIDRPEGNETTPKLGSVQLLGDDVERDHLFIDWAMQGYISEHDAAGDCIFEARFQSPRMSSYRAYKSPFVGMPAEPPALKVVPTAFEQSQLASAFYVSWNGATEVASWNFYGAEELNHFQLIGSANRTGFETSWTLPGLVKYAYAEAVSQNGTALRISPTYNIDPPADGNYKAASLILDAPEAQIDMSQSIDEMTQHHACSSWATNWTWWVLVGFATWGVYCSACTASSMFTTGKIRKRQGYNQVAQ